MSADPAPVGPSVSGATWVDAVPMTGPSARDPVRRALYRHVAVAGRDVSRDEAAQAVGISRNLAGFHLDRLVAEGLLAAYREMLSGQADPRKGIVVVP